MIEHRPFKELGRFHNDWLNANYHFSFSGYHDPKRMGEGALRVWNDDTIQPHTGFPPHGHQSMEIITYVRTGAITHKDSLGNKGRTEAAAALLKGGADPTVKAGPGPVEGKTALEIATEEGKEAVAALLR